MAGHDVIVDVRVTRTVDKTVVVDCLHPEPGVEATPVDAEMMVKLP